MGLAMKNSKLLFALVVPAVVVASVAVASTYKNVLVDTSKVSNSARSGGTGTTRLEVGYDDEFLYEIGWSEYQDDPCHFRVKGSHRLNDKWVDAAAVDANTSGCKDLSTSFTVDSHFAHTDASEGRFISGIQVCRSDKKDSDQEKLKGIRIRTRTVDANGVVSDTPAGEDDHKLSHCDTWEAWVECDAGKLARRLVIDAYGRSAKSIALECAAVSTGARPSSSGSKK